jgi:hypothetical protein
MKPMAYNNGQGLYNHESNFDRITCMTNFVQQNGNNAHGGCEVFDVGNWKINT